jgi:hypothetical protein
MSHGLFLPKARPPSLINELQAWRLVLPPTAAFTHLTAAELNGWWLPVAPPHPVSLPCARMIPDHDELASTSVATRSHTP